MERRQSPGGGCRAARYRRRRAGSRAPVSGGTRDRRYEFLPPSSHRYLPDDGPKPAVGTLRSRESRRGPPDQESFARAGNLATISRSAAVPPALGRPPDPHHPGGLSRRAGSDPAIGTRATIGVPTTRRLSVSNGSEPGWYADPTGIHHRRYWDGAQWTARVADRFGGTAAHHLQDRYPPPGGAAPVPAAAEPGPPEPEAWLAPFTDEALPQRKRGRRFFRRARVTRSTRRRPRPTSSPNPGPSRSRKLRPRVPPARRTMRWRWPRRCCSAPRRTRASAGARAT